MTVIKQWTTCEFVRQRQVKSEVAGQTDYGNWKSKKL